MDRRHGGYTNKQHVSCQQLLISYHIIEYHIISSHDHASQENTRDTLDHLYWLEKSVNILFYSNKQQQHTFEAHVNNPLNWIYTYHILIYNKTYNNHNQQHVHEISSGMCIRLYKHKFSTSHRLHPIHTSQVLRSSSHHRRNHVHSMCWCMLPMRNLMVCCCVFWLHFVFSSVFAIFSTRINTRIFCTGCVSEVMISHSWRHFARKSCFFVFRNNKNRPKAQHIAIQRYMYGPAQAFCTHSYMPNHTISWSYHPSMHTNNTPCICIANLTWILW